MTGEKQQESFVDFAFVRRINGNGSRERLAWAVLLTSFLVWLAVIVAVPLGVGAYLQNARRALLLSIQANDGTVGLSNGSGQRDAIFVGEPPRTMEGQASVLTNVTDTALVSVYTPDETQVLARLHVYGNSVLELAQATAPRFELSDGVHEIALNLVSGRMRISLLERNGRPVRVRVGTPQGGEVTLENAGQYSLHTTNAATTVVVLEGRANVLAGDQGMVLVENQRAMIPVEGSLDGPLSAERNLVRNGSFSDELQSWTHLAGDVQLADQPEVEVSIVEDDGDDVLRFHRIGIGHADAAVRQVINQDVTDFASLELFVTMRIVEQSLGVCGEQGSECPLFVRIEYVDVYGTSQEWQQGFFSVGEIEAGSTPDVCQFCAAPINPHIRVPPNQVYFYESGNMLELLGQQNIRPRNIRSVSLAAEGHTFDTHVVDVALVAVE